MKSAFFISAGHSDTDPGAVSGKRTEASIAVDARNIVSYYLNKEGVSYIRDGHGYSNLSLRNAIKLIDRADISVEFHCNASVHKSAKGVEAYAKVKHKEISQLMCNAVSKHLQTPLRGEKGWRVTADSQHNRLGFVEEGGIILELFFLSNPTELARWDEVKWLVCRDIAETLIKYHKDNYKGSTCKP